MLCLELIFLQKIILKDSIPQINDSIGPDLFLIQEDTVKNTIVKSLFEGKPLVEENALSVDFEKLIYFPDWITLIFLGIIAYLVFIRFIFNIDFVESLKGILKIESLDEVGFDKTNQRTAYALSPVSVIIYAYYLYFFINPKFLFLDLDYLFLIFCLSIILLFFFRVIIEYAIAILFNSQKTYQVFFNDHLFVLSISGILQIPFLILFTYNQHLIFIWISVIILMVLGVLRMLRGFIIGYQQTEFSKSYIFLYLCSLEILPIIWAWKWLINNH